MRVAATFPQSLAAMAILLAPLPVLAAHDEGPRLEVEASEVSFGVLPPTEIGEAVFILRNTGDDDLTVQPTVKPPLRLVSSPESIPPGESVELVVEAELRGLQGPMTFPVELATNDPDQPTKLLQVTGEVVTFIESHPGYARWTVTRGEADGTIEQTLRASDGEPFEVVSVELPHPGLRQETSTPEDGSRVIGLTLDRWAPVGAITGEVVVHTTHPRQERVVIPVSGFVRPMLAVTPHQIKGEAELTEDAVETLLVRIFTTEPMPIAAVEHDLAGVPEAEVVEIEPGRTYHVLLHLPADLPKGRLRGEVRIVPGGDRAEPVVVPVDATIR